MQHLCISRLTFKSIAILILLVVLFNYLIQGHITYESAKQETVDVLCWKSLCSTVDWQHGTRKEDMHCLHLTSWHADVQLIVLKPQRGLYLPVCAWRGLLKTDAAHLQQVWWCELSLSSPSLSTFTQSALLLKRERHLSAAAKIILLGLICIFYVEEGNIIISWSCDWISNCCKFEKNNMTFFVFDCN